MDYSIEKNIWVQQLRQMLYSIMYRMNNIGVISVMEKKDQGYWLCGRKLHWYIPNGLSFKRNIEWSLTREECRKDLHIKENEKLCLFLGWDIKRKGVDIAIKAVEECRRKDSNLILGIVGFGKSPAQEIKKRIEMSVDVQLEQPWIRFMDSTEDMFSYHRAADVYLSASRREAFSYGILEAISQNVPIVVSDIEGTSWSWKYDKCFKFKNENAIECANAIDQALKYRFEPSNAQKIIQKYSIDSWCKQIMKIYNTMDGK